MDLENVKQLLINAWNELYEFEEGRGDPEGSIHRAKWGIKTALETIGLKEEEQARMN